MIAHARCSWSIGHRVEAFWVNSERFIRKRPESPGWFLEKTPRIKHVLNPIPLDEFLWRFSPTKSPTSNPRKKNNVTKLMVMLGVSPMAGRPACRHDGWSAGWNSASGLLFHPRKINMDLPGTSPIRLRISYKTF